jgi:hypothetical protein
MSLQNYIPTFNRVPTLLLTTYLVTVKQNYAKNVFTLQHHATAPTAQNPNASHKGGLTQYSKYCDKLYITRECKPTIIYII